MRHRGEPFLHGAPVQRAGRGQALPRPTEAAVAQVPARRAPPRPARRVGLVHVLAVPHPEAIAAELTAELAASPAGRVPADGLLPALVARGAPHGVVDPVTLGVVAVHEQRPGFARGSQRLLVRDGVPLLVVRRLPQVPIGSGGIDLGGVILGRRARQATASALDRGALDAALVPTVRRRRIRAGVASGGPLGIGRISQGLGALQDSE